MRNHSRLSLACAVLDVSVMRELRFATMGIFLVGLGGCADSVATAAGSGGHGGTGGDPAGCPLVEPISTSTCEADEDGLECSYGDPMCRRTYRCGQSFADVSMRWWWHERPVCNPPACPPGAPTDGEGCDGTVPTCYYESSSWAGCSGTFDFVAICDGGVWRVTCPDCLC